MNYTEAYKSESYGQYSLGIKIELAMDRQLTEADSYMLNQKAREIYQAIMAETTNLDPKTHESRKAERDELLSLFGNAAVYVKEIPNGYCSDWCHRHLPWFVVTTPKGPITIGWRKRVISIDWKGADGIEQTADQLFPNEEVTKSDRAIHAWGIEKAKHYIQILLQQGSD